MEQDVADFESHSVALKTKATRSATATDKLTVKWPWLLTSGSFWGGARNYDWLVNRKRERAIASVG